MVPLVNAIVAYLSGVLMSLSWWAVIDAYAYGAKKLAATDQLAWWHIIAPLTTTLGCLLINFISRSAISQAESSSWDPSLSTRTQRMLLFSFIGMLFFGVGLSLFIVLALIQPVAKSMSSGITYLCGTCGICLSGMLFKFGRKQSTEEFGF